MRLSELAVAEGRPLLPLPFPQFSLTPHPFTFSCSSDTRGPKRPPPPPSQAREPEGKKQEKGDGESPSLLFLNVCVAVLFYSQKKKNGEEKRVSDWPPLTHQFLATNPSGSGRRLPLRGHAGWDPTPGRLASQPGPATSHPITEGRAAGMQRGFWAQAPRRQSGLEAERQGFGAGSRGLRCQICCSLAGGERGVS